MFFRQRVNLYWNNKSIVIVCLQIMRESFQLQNENIEAFSQDWDDREQLQGMAIQIDKLLNLVNEFGRYQLRSV